MIAKMSFWERILIPEQIKIPYVAGLIYRIVTKILRKKVDKLDIQQISLNSDYREQILTCSLTSFPDRISTVHYTIKSLYNQSVKPDRIILWLSSAEFDGVELPESIKALQRKGLEIRFCENLYGHKRYYKMIEEQKTNELLLMFDDDIIFHYYTIERLYTKWKQHQDCIICDRGQRLTFKDNDIENPGFWPVCSKVGLYEPSFRILASPGGGCLVPPNAFYKDANNVELIKKYALKTGDIWLMFMAVQNNTKIIRTHCFHRAFILSESHQTVQLGKEAVYLGRYVQTFNNLVKVYPHAYNNMLSEIE